MLPSIVNVQVAKAQEGLPNPPGFEEPDLIVTAAEWGEDTRHYPDRPSFNGLVKIVYRDGSYLLNWIKDGRLHREFGPASAVIAKNGTLWGYYYYLNGVSYSANLKEYWAVLYEKCKGTDQESLVLAQLLTCNTI